MDGPELLHPASDGVRGACAARELRLAVCAESCDAMRRARARGRYQVGWTFRPIFSWAS